MKPTSIEDARRMGLLPAAEAKAAKPGSDRTKLEDRFLDAFEFAADVAAIEKDGVLLCSPHTQYKFHPKRKWKFDFAWPAVKIAVEIQGGTWIKGRHTSGSSREKEYEKHNAAASAGWCVLQYGTEAMKDACNVAAEVADILRKRIQEQSQ